MNRKAVSLALFVTLICSFGLANDLTAADEEEPHSGERGGDLRCRSGH